MTVPRLNAIAERWKLCPPLSVSVAAVAASLGVPIGQKTPQQGDLQSLVDTLGSVGLNQGMPEWLTKTT